MRTLLGFIVLLALTPPFAAIVVIAANLGLKDRKGSLFEWLPRVWARALNAAGGMRLRVHNEERMLDPAPHIYVCNHLSWFDVTALVAVLPRFKFVAKAELGRIPIFGPGMRAVGTVEIERENRKAAFAAYQQAALRIRAGDPVVVFPEGTRGTTYAIRPFKKGPFVLAIASGVPIVPTIIHGTIHVLPRGSWWLRSGDVDIHFLEPVPTAGLGYEDRDRLAAEVRERMAAAMREIYGVDSPDAEPNAPADAPAR
ncbi:MAG TPA: lysophospholipid acyltransferase family protein [Gemmatimonadaceae bacterium]|nr:lysophospholipid acyltransferase family protein [Gemmatimonadaceae bacterium]